MQRLRHGVYSCLQETVRRLPWHSYQNSLKQAILSLKSRDHVLIASTEETTKEIITSVIEGD